MSSSFNPQEHLRKIQGNATYLDVKWRLVWLRQDHPEASIKTEQLVFNNNIAAFRATVSYPVRLESGDVIVAEATGHGQETPGDFRDYFEKAETKALGRALAALGYGTQFADDFDMGNADGTPHYVDAPVSRSTATVTAARSNRGGSVSLPDPNGPGGTFVCEHDGCGVQLKAGTKKTGETFTAQERASWSVAAKGKILCYTHSKAS